MTEGLGGDPAEPFRHALPIHSLLTEENELERCAIRMEHGTTDRRKTSELLGSPGYGLVFQKMPGEITN